MSSIELPVRTGNRLPCRASSFIAQLCSRETINALFVLPLIAMGSYTLMAAMPIPGIVKTELALTTQQYAWTNVALVGVWLVVVAGIYSEHGKLVQS
jgi:hypothetical protein